MRIVPVSRHLPATTGMELMGSRTSGLMQPRSHSAGNVVTALLSSMPNPTVGNFRATKEKDDKDFVRRKSFLGNV